MLVRLSFCYPFCLGLLLWFYWLLCCDRFVVSSSLGLQCLLIGDLGASVLIIVLDYVFLFGLRFIRIGIGVF